MIVLERNHFDRPVGKVEIDFDLLGLSEEPKDLALVPAFNVETGEIYNWALVPISEVHA